MNPGQYFGEMAIIDAWPRSATIVAEDELHTIELTGSDLISYFTKQPDTILALMNQLGGRLRHRQLTAEYEEVNAFIREKQAPGAEKKRRVPGPAEKVSGNQHPQQQACRLHG